MVTWRMSFKHDQLKILPMSALRDTDGLAPLPNCHAAPSSYAYLGQRLGLQSLR